MLRDSFRLLKYNFSHIIIFELICKIVIVALLTPLLYTLLNFSVSLAGIDYLTAGQMKRYFRAPSTYVLFFVILFLLALYMLMNVSGLVYGLDASHHKEKTFSFAMLFNGVTDGLRLHHLKNLPLLFYMPFAMPFLYTILFSGAVFGLKTPQFLVRFYRQNKTFLLILLALYIVACFALVRRIFTLHCYSVYDLSYPESRRRSKQLTKGKTLKIVIGLTLINVFFTALLVFLGGAVSTAFMAVLSKVLSYKKLVFVINLVIRVLFLINYILISLVATPFIMSYLSVWFYKLEHDKGFESQKEEKKSLQKKRKEGLIEKRRPRHILAVTLISIVAMILNMYYIFLLTRHKVRLNIAYSTRASVTAHRGDSEHAPENTMSAIRLAAENQADIIEIDVRQTADGVFVLMHDENLARTTGVNKRVGDCTFSYIQTLDAGSKFSGDYAGEPVPTLREALAYAAEEDIFLNIELKPAKTDQNYVDGILQLIYEYGLEEDCVIASSDYKTIKEVKMKNPDLTTVYIMTLAFGEIGDMEYADIFSIRKSYISSRMVKSVHRAGKKIYAWTVNSERDIKDALLLNVDSVITDDPFRTKDIIYNANDSLLSDWLQRLVESY